MVEMHLANLWFGNRAVSLAEQLQKAAEMGFHGVGMLSGGVSKGAESGLAATHTESSKVVVVAADQLLPAREPTPDDFQWLPQDVELILTRLKSLRCAHLLVPAGLDARPEAIERGKEILSRVHGGEQVQVTDNNSLQFFAELPSRSWEQQLTRLVAFLYQLRRRAPGLKISLLPEASPAGLLNPHRLRMLLEEIGTFQIGYWHDTAAMETRFMATGEAPGEWLDRFSNIMSGSTLHDFSGGSEHLPPGLGQVDWQLLREYLPRETIRVLAAAPSYPGEILTECRSDLESRLNP
jgi:sugar phosphate isomerase/epimerase